MSVNNINEIHVIPEVNGQAVSGSNPMPVTGSIAVSGGVNANTFDSAGNPIGSTAGALNVYDSQLVTATSAVSSVAGSVTSVMLLATNVARKAATAYNDSTSYAYVKFGTTASTSSFSVKMAPKSFLSLDLPVYTSRIDAIWDTAVGAMRITEFT